MASVVVVIVGAISKCGCRQNQITNKSKRFVPSLTQIINLGTAIASLTMKKFLYSIKRRNTSSVIYATRSCTRDRVYPYIACRYTRKQWTRCQIRCPIGPTLKSRFLEWTAFQQKIYGTMSDKRMAANPTQMMMSQRPKRKLNVSSKTKRVSSVIY